MKLVAGVVAAVLGTAVALPTAAQSNASGAPAAQQQAAKPSDAELDAIEQRYKAVLKELEEIERQQQAIDQLITRAAAIESARGGAPNTAPAQPQQQAGAAAAPAQASTAQPQQQARAAAAPAQASTAQPQQARPPAAPAQASSAQAQAAPRTQTAATQAAPQQGAQTQQAQAARPQAAPAQATQQTAQAQTAQAPRPAQAQQQPQQAQQAAARPAQQAAPQPQQVASAAPAGQPQTVGAERREELESQQQAPELPRVSSEVGGVLTPKGRIVLEPSMGYSYSSVSRVAIEGFTILPALLIGIIDVVEADRDTYLSSLSARMGLTHRLELEVKSTYVYRKDATRSREYLKDSVSDNVFNANGNGMGDYELGLRYQFARRKPTSPYLVGNLRYKAANGTDPFAIATQSQLSGEPQFTQELPTGSGFRSLSPSLTFIYPTDPVVFFGSIGYMWTQADNKGIWYDAEGKRYGFGVVNPGDAIRTSFGLGLGLNDRSSLSLSYALDKFTKTYIETASQQEISGSDVTVGKLLVGYSLKLDNGAPLNLAIGIGTTGDAADTDLTFRMPFSFR